MFTPQKTKHNTNSSLPSSSLPGLKRRQEQGQHREPLYFLLGRHTVTVRNRTKTAYKKNFCLSSPCVYFVYRIGFQKSSSASSHQSQFLSDRVRPTESVHKTGAPRRPSNRTRLQSKRRGFECECVFALFGIQWYTLGI